MPNKCLYPICKPRSNCGKLKSVFRFPKNLELREKWKQNIPLVDFDRNIDLDHRHLCEDHFQESEIVIKNKSKKLIPNAIPTIFEELNSEEFLKYKEFQPKPIVRLPDHDNNCRLCLRKFEPFDEKINICKKVRKQFLILTNTELRQSKVYSQIVCKKCLEELKKSYHFKKNLVSNQEKLHRIFESMEEELGHDKSCQENAQQLGEAIKIAKDHNHQQADDPLNKLILESAIVEPEPDQIIQEILTEFPEIQAEKDDDGIEEYKIEKETYNQKRLRIAKERILCAECGKYFSRAGIKKHIGRTHLKIVRAICDLCNRSFYTKHGLTEHMKIHIGVKSYKCDHSGCEESFMSRGGLHAHRNLKHLGTYDIYCHLCGKKFYSKVNFETHLRSSHTGERPFICDDPNCGKAYFSKTMLQSHKKNVHAGPVTCQTCGKVYSSGDCLRKHMKTHQDVRFTCNFQMCGKQFVTNHLLQLHMKIHLGKKDYACPQCNLRYHKNVSLKKHIWSIHMKLRIACELPGCRSDFARKEIYRKHVLTHHQNIGEDNIKQLLEKIRNMQLPPPVYDKSVDDVVIQ